MRVTELEYVALTMMATRDNVLQTRFGPGWVELLDTPENQWAHEALRGMRASQPAPKANRERALLFFPKYAGVQIGRFSGQEGWIDKNGTFGGQPTHWMPLPEPPEDTTT